MKAKGVVRRFIEHGTREDGIRECVEELDFVSGDYCFHGDHKASYVVNYCIERLEALLDKPEPTILSIDQAEGGDENQY